MKTKWGSCNAKQRTIRLNTEFVKKPRDLLEYVVVHELIQIFAPTHSPRFFDLLPTHDLSWSEVRAELNELPIPAL
ncbi:M48 family metallopeptidase [Yoonia sp. R2331]|uniref:M48 metallopeptidase family protein n=1 Tax=Yoonia sp. R2331 TaxID=3237238 RepID=UPI0034E52F2F